MKIHIILFNLFCLLTPILGIHAQSITNEDQHAAIREFYDNYKKDDYKSMRKQMNWILRLVLPTKAIQGMFESDKMMFGDPQLVEIKNRTENSLEVIVKFSNDTTETMVMGYNLSKKNKINGMRKSSGKFILEKKSNKLSLEQRIASIDSLMQLKERATKFNGCVLVMENGNIVFTKSIGEANRSTHQSINDSTAFELASCSKQFTAVAILMLMEEGKLNLDDPITKWLTELPYHEVTIRHLLNHTGGISDYMDLMDKKWDKSKIAFNSDMINLFAKEKPKAEFKPGEKHEYSNTGYAFLASIIERVSGLTYAQFLKQRIFDPLGMNHSRVYNSRRSSDEIIDNYALGYVYDTKSNSYVLPDSLPEMDIVYWLDGITGDGTVNSTILDLAKWENALFTNQLISQTTTLTAMSATKLNNGEKVDYGYGWGIQDDGKHQKVVYHTGSWPGYITLIAHLPESERSIVILSNNEYYFIQNMGQKIAQIMNR